MDHFRPEAVYQPAQSSNLCKPRHISRERVQRDIKCSDLAHMYVFVTIVPHDDRRIVETAIHRFKEIAELSF
jgi:hypothetical protein